MMANSNIGKLTELNTPWIGYNQFGTHLLGTYNPSGNKGVIGSGIGSNNENAV